MTDSLNTKMVTKQLWLIQAIQNYNRKNIKDWFKKTDLQQLL